MKELRALKGSTVSDYISALKQANLGLEEVTFMTLFEDFHSSALLLIKELGFLTIVFYPPFSYFKKN